jgi:hypothetical protein
MTWAYNWTHDLGTCWLLENRQVLLALAAMAVISWLFVVASTAKQDWILSMWAHIVLTFHTETWRWHNCHRDACAYVKRFVLNTMCGDIRDVCGPGMVEDRKAVDSLLWSSQRETRRTMTRYITDLVAYPIKSTKLQTLGELLVPYR